MPHGSHASNRARPNVTSGQSQTTASTTGPILSHTSSSLRRTVRRNQLKEIVPLADTTIYEMEQRGEFPRRFYLTPRCVVWDLAEVQAWIEQRRRKSDANLLERAPTPDVGLRKSRPVKRRLRP
jgi:prophage regulatory protein